MAWVHVDCRGDGVDTATSLVRMDSGLAIDTRLTCQKVLNAPVEVQLQHDASGVAEQTFAVYI